MQFNGSLKAKERVLSHLHKKRYLLYIYKHHVISVIRNLFTKPNKHKMNRNVFLKRSALSAAALASLPAFAHFSSKEGKGDKPLEPKIVRSGEGKQVNVIGDKQTFKLTSKDTNGLFTLIEEVNPPGTMIPPHVHTNEDEIFKVLEGELEVTVGDETTILKAGDLAFAPKNVPHTWKVVGDQDCKTILSVFPAGLELMFEELGNLPPGPPDFAKVSEICGRYGISFLA